MAPARASVNIATFYRFARLEGVASWRAPLAALCERGGLRGSLALAPEGVNGALAGARGAIDAVLEWLVDATGSGPLDARWTAADSAPFRRMRVRVQPEIVTMGEEGVGPPGPGRRVQPARWNALLDDPDALALDVRNDYEVALGRFAGAHSGGIASFAAFPAFADRLDPAAHRRVAMYCTGGIRCEKAAACLARRGFGEVHQLAGGILAYLQDVPKSQSRWQGHCFVFDERVRLDGALSPAASGR